MNRDLTLQKNLADIQEINARSKYYGQEGDWRQSEIAKAGYPHAISGPKVDDQGKQWQTVMDPATGAVSDKPVGFTPPEGYVPTFKNEEKNQRMSQPGGLQGEIMSNLMSSDPALVEQGKKQQAIYQQMNAGMAGARTAAEQDAPHPQADTASFIEQQKQGLYKDLKSPETDPEKYYFNDMISDKPAASHDAAMAKQQKELSTYHTQVTSRTQNFAAYQNKEMKTRSGKPFDPTVNYMTPNSKAPAAKVPPRNPFAAPQQ